MERIALELRGIPCQAMVLTNTTNKTIIASRSFGLGMAEASDRTRYDGTIYFGQSFLIALHRANARDWPQLASLVVGHETGHILQFRQGLVLPTKQQELHADFLAGFALGSNSTGLLGESETRERMIRLFNKANLAGNSQAAVNSLSDRANTAANGLTAQRNGMSLAEAASQCLRDLGLR